MSEANKELQGKIAAALFNNLRDVVGGADADLHTYVAPIARDMVAAVQTGNEGDKRELIAQLKGVVEANRIRANAAGWKALYAVVGFAFDLAIDGAFGLLEPAPDDEDEDPNDQVGGA